MKKIADTNFIQDEKLLRAFLSRSPAYRVVLTDYMAMELYNSGGVDALYRATKVLSEFPGQALVLKEIATVCGLSGRLAGLQRRLIDERQSAELPLFYHVVEAAHNGDRQYTRELERLSADAAKQLEVVLEGVRGSPEAYEGIATQFSNSDLKAFRSGVAFSKDMAVKIVNFCMELSADVMEQHPMVHKFPRRDEFTNTYIFRASLCNCVLALWWISVGGAGGARPERLRNDVVDSYLAAYSTYFDGVLSSDRKLNDIYGASRFILAAAFGR
ncbi:MAG: hypothetical protein Q7T36_09390 [Fluviicoccus sp.]|uniref:hypothetical protein n=1 Tax=Fluviicoccus sp. TaxID=2003552 RepID=UPI0027243C59|nr:hypothetical protein [Fluviicoccus sp.]MDO8330672.1 hypothetical protein [Fluviicoccus sp.]